MRRFYLASILVFISFLFVGQVFGQALNQIQFNAGSQIEIVGTSTGSTFEISTKPTSGGAIHIYARSSGTGIYVASSTNYVGIGTTNPQYLLDVGSGAGNFGDIISGSFSTSAHGPVLTSGDGYIQVGDINFSGYPIIVRGNTSSMEINDTGVHFVGRGEFDQAVTIGYPAVSTDAMRKDYADAYYAPISGASGIWKLSGNNISASSTSYNVAIGTSTPAGKLHVYGFGYSDQNAGADSVTNPTTTTAGGIVLDGSYSNGFYRTRLVKIDRGGNLPLYIQDSYGSTAFNNVARFGSHSYSTNKFEVFGNTAISGNLGVGVTSPSSLLHLSANPPVVRLQDNANASSTTAVDGYILLTDSANSQYGYIGDGSTGTNNIDIYGGTTHGVSLFGGGTRGLTVNTSGNVGVGTTTFTGKFTASTEGSWNLGDTYPFQFINIDGQGNEGDGLLVKGGALSANSNIFTVQDFNGANVFNVNGAGAASFSNPVTVGYPSASTDAMRKDYADAYYAPISGGSGVWKLSTNNLYTSSTSYKVGIGLSTPTSSLTVSNAEAAATDFITPVEIRRSWGSGSATTRQTGLIFTDSNSVNGGVFAMRTNSSANYRSDLAFFTNGGSSNMLPSSALGERMRIDYLGNVGFGTTTPVGSAHFWSTSGDEIVYIEADADNDAEDDNPALILRQDGNLVNGLFGIMGATAQYTGALSNTIFIEAKDSGSSAAIQFVTGGTTIGGTNGTARMTIAQAGNIGIGTTTPSNKLHLYSATSGETALTTGIRIENDGASNSEAAASFFTDQTGSSGWITGINNDNDYTIAYGTSFSDANTKFKILDSGNVGIGTTTPSVTLKVEGQIHALTSASANLNSASYEFAGNNFGGNTYYAYNSFCAGNANHDCVGSGGVTIATGAVGTPAVAIYSSGNSYFNSAGNLGVGTTTPSTKLHVVTGGGNAATFSSQVTVGYPLVATDAATKSYVDAAAGLTQYWIQSGSNLYASSTSWNLGIGTATPATKLDVNGTETTNRISQTASGSTYTELATRSWGGNAAIFFSAYATSSYINGDFLTVGNTKHKYAASAFGSADHRAKAIIADHTGIGLYVSNASGGADQNVTWNQELLTTNSTVYIPTNNVGIGESAPGSKLSVSGGATIGATYDTTVAPTNGLVVEGSVGVGSSNPTNGKLEVQAGSGIAGYFESTSDNQITLKSSNSWAGIGFSDLGGTDYMWFRGGNNTFAIGGGGADVAGKKLHVDGGMSIGANSDASSTPANGLIVQGGVTAASFTGDGSALTGITATDSTKVAKAGDTMTGVLNVNASMAASDSGIVNITNTNVTGTVGTSTALRIFGADFGNYSGSTYNTIGAHITGGDTWGGNHRSYAVYAEIGSGGGSEYAAYFGGSVGINTLTPAGALDVASAGTAEGYWLDGKAALTGESSDNWLRLNQSSSWTNGVYVPSLLRTDGGLVSGAVSGAGAGTIRTTSNIHASGTIGGAGTTGTAGAYGNTWRLGDNGSAANSWLYLYNGSGSTYHDLALGNLWVSGAISNVNNITQVAGSTSTLRRINAIASGSGWDDGLNLYSNDGTNRWNLLVDNGAGDAFRLAYNNSEVLFASTTGSVGIGTASPDGFQVNRATSETGDGTDNIRLGIVSGTPRIIFEDAATSTLWQIDNAAGSMRFFIPGSVKMTLDTAGTLTVNKINAAEVDPPYTIGGKKYATYMAGMTGLKEETTGVVKLKNNKAVLDLVGSSENSDLWLFGKTINISAASYVGEDGKAYKTSEDKILDGIVVLLTPNFDGRVWYEKKDGKILISSSEKTGEISYRLTAPRFDAVKKNGNLRLDLDPVEGLNLDKLLK